MFFHWCESESCAVLKWQVHASIARSLHTGGNLIWHYCNNKRLILKMFVQLYARVCGYNGATDSG